MQSVTHNGIIWRDYPNPTEQELRDLQSTYHVHDLDIEDCLSENERPKIEEYEHYLFLVFHIPYLRNDRIVKEEVNIFLGADFVATIHSNNIPLIGKMFQEVQEFHEKKMEYMQEGTGFFLYELMRQLFDQGFPLVDIIRKKMRTIEEELFEKEEQTDVHRDILAVKRNIISMRSVLQPQRTLVAVLEHKNKKFIAPELAIYFDNILDAIERQWSLLETAKEMSEALHETHESLLSHKTNAIVRVLTVINVFSLFPIFVTGLYGMNVTLPLGHNPYAFLVISGVIGIITLWTAWIFAKKKWL